MRCELHEIRNKTGNGGYFCHHGVPCHHGVIATAVCMVFNEQWVTCPVRAHSSKCKEKASNGATEQNK